MISNASDRKNLYHHFCNLDQSIFRITIYNDFFLMLYPVLQADLLRGYELDFLIDTGLSLLAGFLIGAERESRGKAADISTHCFVIAGSDFYIFIGACRSKFVIKDSCSACIRNWVPWCGHYFEKRNR